MRRIGIILSILVVIGLVTGAGYWGYASNQPQTPAAVEAPLTVKAAICDVQQTVTAPGSLVNTRTAEIEMPFAEQLAEVLVRAGERVSVGQVLARLANKTTYEAAVATAQLELAQAQQALADLHAEAPLKAAQAQLELAEAQKELAQAKRTLAALLSPDVTYYQQRVERAQDAVDLALKNASLTDLASAVRQAEEALEDAASGLKEWQKQNETYPGAYAEMVKQAQRRYEAALENLQNATLRYEQAQITNANAVEDAQAELQAAQNALAGALAKPNTIQVSVAEAELAVKQALVTQAQAKWESLQNGPTALALSEAEARVTQAATALASAQAALAQIEIKAPFAGVILQVNASAGQTAPAAQTLFTLADPQAMEAETTVIEEDVPYVQVGQPVEVYFDALPGEIITGTVARIVPQRITGDRPLYHVYIALSQTPAALFEGMSADASIIIAQRQGVLCLPRALAQASADGAAIVEVWANGQTEKRTLTIGLRGDTYVEVLSGLAEGEAVVAK